MPEVTFKHLDRLVGTWRTAATHPAMPGVVVHGRVTAEWLEGRRFLIHRAVTDHPDFPDAISIIGFSDHDRVDPAGVVEPTGALRMHYFDSRGVYRLMEASVDAQSLRLTRIAPGFSQRFTGTFMDGGDTMDGVWELRTDDVHWKDDVRITYRRT